MRPRHRPLSPALPRGPAMRLPRCFSCMQLST
jgi:hypothetical protein